MKIGDVIDGLGVDASIAEDDLVAGAVVLLKVVEDDGDVRLSVAWAEGMSWMERLGMLDAAHNGERPPPDPDQFERGLQ